MTGSRNTNDIAGAMSVPRGASAGSIYILFNQNPLHGALTGLGAAKAAPALTIIALGAVIVTSRRSNPGIREDPPYRGRYAHIQRCFHGSTWVPLNQNTLHNAIIRPGVAMVIPRDQVRGGTLTHSYLVSQLCA